MKPIKVRGKIRDLIAFQNMAKYRQKMFDKASDQPLKDLPYINFLAKTLHPAYQYFKVTEVIEETDSTKSYILKPLDESKLPVFFQAGQYISVWVTIDEYEIARPFSISSAPYESLQGYYQITIKRMEDGYVSTYIYDNWEIGTKIKTSAPMGTFYYEPLRDNKSIIAIAGGSGITPVRSLLREMLHSTQDLSNWSLTLFYGCSDDQELLFYPEFMEYIKKYPNRFKLHMVMSCEDTTVENSEQGFITKEIIQKYVPDLLDHSYFICGPSIMYDFVWKELEELKLPQKLIRSECYGEMKSPGRFESYPAENLNKTFTMKVHTPYGVEVIKISGQETVLVALEKVKIQIPNACRSGECAFCRSRLLKGEIWVSPYSDGRRIADKYYGYFHPCASFPLSDLEIDLPRMNN